MKITKVKGRKAISPIIATVLIIAVTLIAAVAIGGFVFGLFGSSTNTAQVQAVSVALAHVNSGGAALVAACATAPGAANYIQFSNSGSANTVVSSLSLTYGGVTYSATPTGTCTVTAGTSSFYLTMAAGALGAVSQTAGQQFTGFVVTANGAQVVFTGTFS